MDSSNPIQGYRAAQEALTDARQSVALKVHNSDTAAERLLNRSDTSVHGLDALAELAAAVPEGSLAGAQDLVDALVGWREAQLDVDRAWDLVLRNDVAPRLL